MIIECPHSDLNQRSFAYKANALTNYAIGARLGTPKSPHALLSYPLFKLEEARAENASRKN